MSKHLVSMRLLWLLFSLEDHFWPFIFPRLSPARVPYLLFFGLGGCCLDGMRTVGGPIPGVVCSSPVQVLV